MSPTMRARQVRCTTYIEVAIRTLPPNAKITADVCSGRSRPNERNETSRLSAGKASSSAIQSPTANPAMPQNTAITVANFTGPIL